MSNRKGNAIVIIAIVIGVSGLGMGAFSVIKYEIVEGPQGPEGPPGLDGIDGVNGTDGVDGVDGKNGTDIPNTYYCSSQLEIEEAFETIGTGNGHIFITNDIVLNSTIIIDNGGEYVIQGVGQVTLNRNASTTTIQVANTTFLIIKDIIIDASNLTSEFSHCITVDEVNNNPVQIQNVWIYGSGTGRGIRADSENVWIENCLIEGMHTGLFLYTGSSHGHIIGNTIRHISVYGIRAYENHQVIQGNILYDISRFGIQLSGDYNTISGNTVFDIFSGGSGTVFGINVGGYSNSITGNTISTVSGATGIGIRLDHGRYHTCTANTLGYISDYGIYLDMMCEYSIVMSNTLYASGSIRNDGLYNVVEHNIIN